MWGRVTILGLAVLLGPVVPARADRLILTDGRTLSGKVTIERGEDSDSRVYVIVTDDGQTLTFSKAEVKRSVHESSPSDWELLEMFEEWQDLVRPVLDEEEPRQREFMMFQLRYVRSFESGRHANIPMREDVRTIETEKVDSDAFVDEWARYTSRFKALADTLAYKQYTSRQRGSNSLREFASYPPEGHEQVAKALRWALDSVEQSFKSAETTNNMVRNLPRERGKYEAKVRNAEAAAERAHARRSTLKDAKKRHEQNLEYACRAAEKDAEIHQRIAKLINTVEKKTQAADTKINGLARERTAALQHLVDTRRQIEEVQVRGDRATSRSQAAPEVTVLPSGPVTRAFQRVVSKHRSDAKGLTALGLKTLREDTQSAVDELFVGKQFALRLSVDNIYEASPDGYALAADHRSGFGEEIVRTVEFRFGGGVRYRLIKCKVGDEVELEARIRRVSFRPALPELEMSDQAASVHLSGDVVAVNSGCKER